ICAARPPLRFWFPGRQPGWAADFRRAGWAAGRSSFPNAGGIRRIRGALIGDSPFVFVLKTARVALFSGIGAMLLAVGVAAGQGADKQPPARSVTPRGNLSADEKATIDLFRRSSPAVVYITTLQQVINLLTMNVMAVPRGTGSGFVWDDKGHIVTNYHVIAGAKEAKIRLSDQRTFDAAL